MEQIGRYRILAEVGRGAMGVVYRAQDPAIGRTVAIKTIRLSDFVDPGERSKLHDRLAREAQSAGMLSHPGIVTIYDVGEEGDTAYIAMEFVDGPSLDRMLISEPPDAALVLSILRQTAAALDYAHKRGIVHRDIKPANIMVHERATAKITDFGVAKIQSHQMTHAGSMIGTPNYMSPEQIQGQTVSGSSDQFSLAVIAYELLSGEKPFTGESMPALVFKIVQEDPVPVQRLNSTLGWAVDTVLKRALAKNPADRYPTCSDFVFALENACRSSKNWKPITPGILPDLPTFAGTLRPGTGAPVPPVIEPAARIDQSPVVFAHVDEEPPLLLRMARVVGIIVFAGALVAALLVWSLERFSRPDEKSVKGEEVKVEEKAATTEQRPSPAPPPPSPEPETPIPTPQEPAADPPKPEAPKALPGETQPVTATMRLVTNPPGAYVVIDGKSEQSCMSPCTLTLPRGRHSLATNKEGYRRALRIVEAGPDEEVFVNLDPTSGTVRIRSQPSGAQIYVDGRLRTEQTPAMLTLPTGPHSIEVVRDGVKETQQITVQESMITNLSINLEDK